MKYPDINIQMKYPNKLINADTPSVCLRWESPPLTSLTYHLSPIKRLPGDILAHWHEYTTLPPVRFALTKRVYGTRRVARSLK